jgi:Fe-S cluster assembly ATPase SufC
MERERAVDRPTGLTGFTAVTLITNIKNFSNYSTVKMKTYSIDFRQKLRDVYHNEPLSQRAIANRFLGALELRTKIALHSIVRPKILLLELSDAESN